MLAKIQEFIGDLWGKTTTYALAIAAAIVAVPIPTELLNPTVRWVLFAAAVIVAAARYLAPPPQSVTVKREDAMVVDHENGTIVIAKAVDIPESTVSKAAGEA